MQTATTAWALRLARSSLVLHGAWCIDRKWEGGGQRGSTAPQWPSSSSRVDSLCISCWLAPRATSGAATRPDRHVLGWGQKNSPTEPWQSDNAPVTLEWT
ncbi:hypothetical protein CCMA1212_003012 [Trichoderma ghanense]|uniref:Secreted protein n=1 Tax=Trichoderma ghanense TaxID=65468 RepID=A0ABY2HAZ3_9HYPO